MTALHRLHIHAFFFEHMTPQLHIRAFVGLRAQTSTQMSIKSSRAEKHQDRLDDDDDSLHRTRYAIWRFRGPRYRCHAAHARLSVVRQRAVDDDVTGLGFVQTWT